MDLAAPLDLIDAPTRIAVQRRTLRVLAAAQVVGAAALGAAMTISAFVVEDIVGVHTPWVGIAGTATTAGSGVAAEVLSRVMRRRGRRFGMAWGYVVAAVGGLIAFAGVEAGSLSIFLGGLFLHGTAISTNMLARYAATDLALPHEQSRAMGRILFASTFGAIFGPTLVVPAEHAGVALGLDRYAGPWIGAAVFCALTGALIAAWLRPDPLLLVGGGAGDSEGRLLDSLRVILASPPASLALLAMVVAQIAMVGIVGIAPLDMKSHHHEAISSLVISMHVAGMYAFASLAGRAGDRFGAVPAMAAGTVLVAVSCVLSPAASTSVVTMFVAMFTLGVGWALAIIAGSTLLSDSVPAVHRVHAQGTADLVTAFAGGLASVLYGVALGRIGFGAVALVSLVLTVPVLAWVARGPVLAASGMPGAIEAE